ncbi:MAG: hypothetical protein ABDH66_01390 [Bacteroidia bacterium]
MAKLLPFLPWIEITLKWSIEMLISFFVGSETTIGSIEAIDIDASGRWNIQLTQVRIASTLPADSQPVACFRKVSLCGRGKWIDTVAIAGGELNLIRINKSHKNFRLFPKRGKAATTQNIVLIAESVRFRLFNFPPQVFLTFAIDSLFGQVRVESLFIQVAEGKVSFHAEETCIGRTFRTFSGPVSLRLKGSYHKKTDIWQNVHLSLTLDEGHINFEGEVEKWDSPIGKIGGFLTSDAAQLLFVSYSEWIGSERLYFSGEINRLAYEIRLNGTWKMGEYDICLTGKRDTIVWVAAKLGISPWGNLSLYGPLHALHIYGKGKLQSLALSLSGKVDLLSRRGLGILRDAYGNFLQATGTPSYLTLTGRVEKIFLEGNWEPHRRLCIAVDTAEVGAIQAALGPYLPLLRGKGAFPIEVKISSLLWPPYGILKGVHIQSQKGYLHLSATGEFQPLSLHPHIRLRTTTDFTQGTITASASEGYLYGEWRGDTANLSVIGHWDDLIGEIVAQVERRKNTVYLKHATIHFPTGEQVAVRGTLSIDSADTQIEGSVPLPWLFRYLPLRGIELYQGIMNLQVCASGSWDTLLQWSNPSEGQVSLRNVRGFFPGVGLPLHDLSADLCYFPHETFLNHLSASIGSLNLNAHGQVEGALSYLYTDWYRLKGKLHIDADHLVLSDIWREVNQKDIRLRVRFPSQLKAQITLRISNIDFLGIPIQFANLSGSIDELSSRIDTVEISYQGAQLIGRAALEMQDSTCYTAAGRLIIRGLPIERFLSDMQVGNISTLQKLGIKGIFSGDMQLSLRFTPEVRWLHQSSLYATGSISAGRIKTPQFLRWLRPYYLSAYKDSMDFYAQVSSLSVTDGFLRLPTALLLTRIAAFEISGHHYLPADRFMYRIQAMRVRRRVQKYPNLEALAAAFEELIDSSIGLIYVEKLNEKVVWRYPWRYVLKTLIGLRRLRRQ